MKNPNFLVICKLLQCTLFGLTLSLLYNLIGQLFHFFSFSYPYYSGKWEDTCHWPVNQKYTPFRDENNNLSINFIELTLIIIKVSWDKDWDED